jgi:putative transposase
MTKLGVSERRACKGLGQHRSTQRKALSVPADEAALREEIVALAKLYGRYGYRRVTALLQVAGWCVNPKRVERIWRGSRHCRERAEGAAPAAAARPPVAERRLLRAAAPGAAEPPLGLRLRRGSQPGRPQVPHAVRGRRVHRRGAGHPGGEQARLGRDHRRPGRPVHRPRPAQLRADNGPEFVAKPVPGWIAGVGARTADIGPGSRWEHGYVGSFNGKRRDEPLNCEGFNTLREAQLLIEQWRQPFNTVRPHSALGYRPPAPEGVMLPPPMLLRRPSPTGSAPPAAMLHYHSAPATRWGLVNGLLNNLIPFGLIVWGQTTCTRAMARGG